MNNKLCVLVPGMNEEKVIERTLESLCKYLPIEDIYVVSDGSTDRTVELARKYTSNVLDLKVNRGKAGAINAAVEEFKLTSKYDLVMPVDADTVFGENFVKEMLQVFDADKKKNIAAAVGKVVGKPINYVTSYRVWEYEICQAVYKQAQSYIGAINVCSGCATVYRSEVLKKVGMPTGTHTEDMDLTFNIHRENLGQIVYVPKALVKTQDPKTVKDLLKQLKRWYTGFWQCVVKHNVPWGGQKLDGEVGLLAIEGLFNSLIVLAILGFTPLSLMKFPNLIVQPLLIDLFLFMLPTTIWVAHRHKNYKMVAYIPAFYVLRGITALWFIRWFLAVVIGFDPKGSWSHVKRYATA